jgi:hypothetical protein
MQVFFFDGRTGVGKQIVCVFAQQRGDFFDGHVCIIKVAKLNKKKKMRILLRPKG